MPPRQRRTNVWRKVTSPAWRAKRLRSGRRRSTARSPGRSRAGCSDGTDERAGHEQMVQCGADGLAATADAMGRAQDRAPDRGLAEARRTTPSGRHEEARFLTLEHDAGQPAGRNRSDVDVDRIRYNLGPIARRGPCTAELAKIHANIQTRIRKPQQVSDGLALEGIARPYAPMAEEIFSGDDRSLQRSKDLEVLARHRKL